MVGIIIIKYNKRIWVIIEVIIIKTNTKRDLYSWFGVLNKRSLKKFALTRE